MGHRAPDHSAEISALREHSAKQYLSPLEAKAVLTAIEMLEAHETGTLEICDLPHARSLVTLCMGKTFEPMGSAPDETTLRDGR